MPEITYNWFQPTLDLFQELDDFFSRAAGGKKLRNLGKDRKNHTRIQSKWEGAEGTLRSEKEAFRRGAGNPRTRKSRKRSYFSKGITAHG